MKLYYFDSVTGNFGDDLNLWLWDKLMPNFFDGNDDTIFVGIGTLLNHRIPTQPKKIIFGSGFGYGDKPKLDNRWEFSCVRGPLTAEALGIHRSLAVTDAAALVNTLPLCKPVQDGGIAFMPHCYSSYIADWEQVCRRIGIRYIDSSWEVERVIHEVYRTEILIAEAMHGAIIADTLRVPWVPVCCYEHILAFKWIDWSQSLGLDYSPTFLPGIWDEERNFSTKRKLKNKIKRGLITIGFSSNSWDKPPRKKSSLSEYDILAESFTQLLGNLHPQLSDDRKFSEAVERLQEKLNHVIESHGTTT